ncbi:MAG: tripartite tricarboxylate transporter TctB family protein [Syntrophobacterales bacterium]|nr:tripartite tricarboxylate transporter TctB family protein [Syntrophobacterales bacterium]
MEQKQTQERPRSVRLTYQAAEMVVAVAIFLIGVAMMMDGYRVGMGWAPEGPEAGYFPFRTGAIIGISSLVVFLRALLGKHRNHELFVSRDRFRQVLYVLIPAVLYVLVTQFIGIYVASALFIGGFMRVMARFNWLKVILVSVCISAALFYAFEIQFMVPLPKGPLESLFGY